MTIQHQCSSVLERLSDSFTGWVNHRRELNEMRRLDPIEFDRIARDTQLSPVELNELVNRGPHAADELQGLLAALGIDAEQLARIEPVAMHDMQRVCALCSHKRECNHDVLSGSSAERYRAYCLNAATLAGLSRHPA